jgi:glutamate synthase domain-containing protein 3
VVVLGPTGGNFGAGMTNGSAYVYDADGTFAARINGDSVLLERPVPETDGGELRHLLERHLRLTRSRLAAHLLDRWDLMLAETWKVIPRATLAATAAEPEAAEDLTIKGAAD